MRRYMDVFDNTSFKDTCTESYKQFKRVRQENEHLIKHSFYKEPCVEPYKQYKQIRQLNEFKIKDVF
jgi:uncharacterized protein YktA (UPF0223 family)